MRYHRRRRGFEPAGAVPAGQLGLPARRARSLALVQAWERVAGRTLARKARACGVERGVLRIEVTDVAWHEAVTPLLPQLAARLVVDQPQLRIKKFRLDLAGAGAIAETRPVPELVAEIDPGAETDGTETSAASDGLRPGDRTQPGPEQDPSASTAEGLQHRLERAAQRYIERRGSQKA